MNGKHGVPSSTAVHEAGHTVARGSYGLATKRVTIEPDGDSEGHSAGYRIGPSDLWHLKRHCVSDYGGGPALRTLLRPGGV